jgi:hypothetical protein
LYLQTHNFVHHGETLSMFILSGVVLILGLLWVLSAIAWGRIRQPVAFPRDEPASGAFLPGFDYDRQGDDGQKAERSRPVLAVIDEMIAP